MQTGPADTEPIRELAAAHGLDVDSETIFINELGLDFRVAIVASSEGDSWVLRIPRRADVTDRASVEGHFLASIAPHLSVAVPDWRIHTRELIAYPLLPGEPGLTLDDQGQPHWHFDVEAAAYADSLGDFLAELHAVQPHVVESSGIEIYTPEEVRERKRADIARVGAEFEVASDLQDRWRAWLDDDRYWPEWTTVTHGEIYPAHQLMVDTEIVGVLDWTTAMVGDPARDFVFHQASVSPQAFDAAVRRYVERGGRAWPLLAEHCAELFSTSAVDYGLYALQTGDSEHMQTAAAQLNPTEQ